MNGGFSVTLLGATDLKVPMSAWSRLWLDHPGCATLAEPNLVIYASSAEAGWVALPAVVAEIAAIKHRHPDARHAFVSMGCLGLHAAILEAQRSQAESVLIFLVEAPGYYLQDMLNIAGLGVGAEGLSAVEGAATLHLVRSETVANDGYGLSMATILAKTPGPGGTLRLLEKLEAVLEPLTAEPSGVDVVSFRMYSRWCDQLLQGFSHLIQAKWTNGTRLLDSYEADCHHNLTVKPLRELAMYGASATQRPLVILTLGAGGRMGVLVLMRGQMPHTRRRANPPSALMAARSGDYLKYSEPLYNCSDFRTDDAYFLDDLTADLDPVPWQPESLTANAVGAGGA